MLGSSRQVGEEVEQDTKPTKKKYAVLHAPVLLVRSSDYPMNGDLVNIHKVEARKDRPKYQGSLG